MFRSFFLSRQWFLWAFPGLALILLATWYKVQIDVDINAWFGDFFDTIQQALTAPNTVKVDDLVEKCLTFAKIASVYIIIAVLLEFFVRHFVFRWRTAMNNYYMQHWQKLRGIEGAAQRVQEDTMRFARIVETLGVSFMRSIMTLFAFLPLLWVLSENITEVLYFGEVEHALIYIAIISAAGGTVLLALVGIKLPGLEFNNQKVEAAYRKELVFGEDNTHRADPISVKTLFTNIRKNYFTLYLHYLYFDIAKWSYLQFSVILPYIALAPTIVAGVMTLGVLQQILQAFNRVENSFQFLVNSWSTIVELMSIYKRLRSFERQINSDADIDDGESLTSEATLDS